MYLDYKIPRRPKELQLLDCLQLRINTSSTDKVIHRNLIKGFAGERRMSNILDQDLTTPCIRLSDLSFINQYNTEFQIDTLLIFSSKIILLEVKNYEGDFYINEDSWHIAETHKEIRNPTQQLKRSHLLFEELLQNLNWDINIESYLVFVNSNFTLFNAPINKSIVLPTQLNRFIQSLNKQTGRPKAAHRKLSNQLIALHNKTPQVNRLAKYEYEQIKKGTFCQNCSSLHTPTQTSIFNCTKCNHTETVENAIINNIVEFDLLFPEMKITTTIIHDWCDEVISKKRIRRILQKHFIQHNNKKNTYYTFAK